MPPKKIPFLTMRGIFDTTYPDLAEEQKLQDGDIVEEAKVRICAFKKKKFITIFPCTGLRNIIRLFIHFRIYEKIKILIFILLCIFEYVVIH